MLHIGTSQVIQSIACARIRFVAGMHADTVGEVTTALADVSTTQAELSESIEDVKAQTGTSLTALYAAIAIEAIVLVLVAVVLIRKRT